MSAILAQMSPEAAERLTIELAVKPGSDRNVNPSNLPKIDGRPGWHLSAPRPLTVNAALNALG